MQFYKTPRYAIAVNPRVCSSAIGKAIAESFYPERIENQIIADDIEYRAFVELTDKPDKPVLLLIREPVDRFLSACALLGLEPGDAIERLEMQLLDDVHFIRQSEFIQGEAIVFCYPHELELFCAAAGFLKPLSIINKSNTSKKIVPEIIAERIKNYYSADTILFELISELAQ